MLVAARSVGACNLVLACRGVVIGLHRVVTAVDLRVGVGMARVYV